MKRDYLKCLIGFELLVGMTSANAFAFAPKAPDPTQDPEYQQELQEIQQNQADINSIVQQMHWVPDNFPIPENATLDQLQDIARAQNDAIRSLTQEEDDQNAETSAEIQKMESDVVDTDTDLMTRQWVESRCTGLDDSISTLPLVQGRSSWAHKCLTNQIDALGKQRIENTAKHRIDRDLEERYWYATETIHLVDNSAGTPWSPGRYWYPVFGQSDPGDGAIWNTDKSKLIDPSGAIHFVAPLNPSDACDVSYNGTTGDGAGTQGKQYQVDLLNQLDFKVVAMCVSGCYTPEQTLAFKDGYQEIGDAFQNGTKEIMAASADSTIDHIDFEPTEIKAYTIDIMPAWQEIVDLETLSGKKLSVTKTHPLLDSNGIMHRAQDLKVGMSLMLADGTPDPLIDMSERDYYGKVYNVRLSTSNPVQNIVIAQGLLTGSVYFQDEGTQDLNRALFRMNIPRSLFQ